MNPIIIKLVGAALGMIIADSAQKKLTGANNARNTSDSKAISGPIGETTDDSEKPSDARSGGGSKRSDSGVPDKPDTKPVKPESINEEQDHEPDQ